MYEQKVLELKHIVPSASCLSCDRPSIKEDSNAFAHASHSVIGTEEANTCTKEGVKINLLWICPEFVKSEQ